MDKKKHGKIFTMLEIIQLNLFTNSPTTLVLQIAFEYLLNQY
jgi:hypothetical protein